MHSIAQHFEIALLALAFEAAAGYPEPLFARIGHPATWLGALISLLDGRLNRGDGAWRRLTGVLALAALLFSSLSAGWLIQKLTLVLPFGAIVLALLASSLLAQRSLHEHVAAVAGSLEISLDAARASVAKIVGRDVAALDEAGVSRAAIESLAENFSDGVVAPALWLALLGLPGALAYKAVNTADSMIGHRTPRYEAFGWASARFDDLLNWPAARLSAALLVLAAIFENGASARGAIGAAKRDARKHASLNAGWPEAAMAGALGLQLGGPRAYDGLPDDSPYLGSGQREARAADIWRALRLYRRAVAGLWLIAALGTILVLL